MAFALKVPVKELLATHTSLELREYMAYEEFSGPLGDVWTREQVTELNYLMQWNNYLLGCWVTKEGEKNPVPEPHYHTWRTDEDEDNDCEV